MKYTWVLPNLAVGPDPRVDEEFQELKALKIAAILSLQTDDDRTDGGIEDERTKADRVGLVFCSVPIEDFNRAQLQTCLPESVAALERMLKQGHSVYVHSLFRRELLANCSRGLSALVSGIRTLPGAHPSACLPSLLAGCRGDPWRPLGGRHGS